MRSRPREFYEDERWEAIGWESVGGLREPWSPRLRARMMMPGDRLADEGFLTAFFVFLIIRVMIENDELQ